MNTEESSSLIGQEQYLQAGEITLRQLSRIQLPDSSARCSHRRVGVYGGDNPGERMIKERCEGDGVLLFSILSSADVQTGLSGLDGEAQSQRRVQHTLFAALLVCDPSYIS